jgi:hypothetical protein
VNFANPFSVAIAFMTAKVVWLGFVALFLAIFIFYFCAIYIPILNAYKGGCVIGNTNGTFLTNNLYSVKLSHEYTNSAV